MQEKIYELLGEIHAADPDFVQAIPNKEGDYIYYYVKHNDRFKSVLNIVREYDVPKLTGYVIVRLQSQTQELEIRFDKKGLMVRCMAELDSGVRVSTFIHEQPELILALLESYRDLITTIQFSNEHADVLALRRLQ